jgi:hypothetical protein
MTDTTLEHRTHRVARRISSGFIQGPGKKYPRFRAEKSCERTLHHNNCGGFRIVDVQTNTVVAGLRYELSPEDVIAHFEGKGR